MKMIESITMSKNLIEKQKMDYKNLQFFVNSSKNRLHKVKAGSRLAHVIESQARENQKAFLSLNA